MAGAGQFLSATIPAGEDLTGSQYHAIALDDAKVANNGKEAGGIIIGKPASGDHAQYGYLGEMKYAAGAAVAAGVRLTVTTSGWLITATASGSYVIGRNSETAVTSGSVGRGIFTFNPAIIPASGM